MGHLATNAVRLLPKAIGSQGQVLGGQTLGAGGGVYGMSASGGGGGGSAAGSPPHGGGGGGGGGGGRGAAPLLQVGLRPKQPTVAADLTREYLDKTLVKAQAAHAAAAASHK